MLTSDDANTNNCVIETNLASDNDLSVGDTFTITTTVNDETIIQELTIVVFMKFNQQMKLVLPISIIQ